MIPLKNILRSITIVIVTLATSIIAAIWLVKTLVNTETAYPFVDGDTMDKGKGYTAVNQKILELVGATGVAVTDLRPSGFIEIEGEKLDAEAEEGFIPKGTQIEVVRVRSINLIVKKI